MAELEKLRKKLDKERGEKMSVAAQLQPELAARFQKMLDDTEAKGALLVKVAIEEMCDSYGY